MKLLSILTAPQFTQRVKTLQHV